MVRAREAPGPMETTEVLSWVNEAQQEMMLLSATNSPATSHPSLTPRYEGHGPDSEVEEAFGLDQEMYEGYGLEQETYEDYGLEQEMYEGYSLDQEMYEDYSFDQEMYEGYGIDGEVEEGSLNPDVGLVHNFGLEPEDETPQSLDRVVGRGLHTNASVDPRAQAEVSERFERRNISAPPSLLGSLLSGP